MSHLSLSMSHLSLSVSHLSFSVSHLSPVMRITVISTHASHSLIYFRFLSLNAQCRLGGSVPHPISLLHPTTLSPTLCLSHSIHPSPTVALSLILSHPLTRDALEGVFPAPSTYFALSSSLILSLTHYLPPLSYPLNRDALEGEFPRAISLFRTSQSYIAQARRAVPSVLAMVWFGQYAPGKYCFLSFVRAAFSFLLYVFFLLCVLFLQYALFLFFCTFYFFFVRTTFLLRISCYTIGLHPSYIVMDEIHTFCT